MKKLTVGLLLLALFIPALFAQADRGPQIAAMSFTIATGESVSGAVAMRGCTPARIHINPAGAGSAAWTTANLTFLGSDDGTTYGNIHDQFGTEVTVTVPNGADAAMKMIVLSPADWWGWRYLKIRSGTSASAVNQAAERTIKVVCAVTK